MQNNVVLVVAIASLLSCAVGVSLFLWYFLQELGQTALNMIQFFTGQTPRCQTPMGIIQPALCQQCRSWPHDQGCPSLSEENLLVYCEGWQDAKQSKAISRPNHPAYMLGRRLYGYFREGEEDKARLNAITMQGHI